MLAPNRPEGMCARGPSMRSAKTVSMIGVAAVGDVGGRGGVVGVGEKRVIPPDREECVGVAGVFDAAHDQPCGHRVRCGSERRCRRFRRLRHQRSSRRCRGHGPHLDSDTGVHACSVIALIAAATAVFLPSTTEKCAPRGDRH